MNTRISRRWLLAALTAFALLPLPARADIVTTDQLANPTAADVERAKVKAFLERANVVEKLQLFGVDSISAADRVDAMSQEEIRTLARNIDSLPAGGEFTTTEIVVIVVLAVLLLVLVL
ncbi:MAG TPA: PA2779 family protein [Azonexus sp.]